MNEISWLLPRLTLYRSLGFFSQFDNLSDMTLIHKLSADSDDFGRKPMQDIMQSVTADDYEILSRQNPYLDFNNELDLLRLDTARVWAGNMECDAGGGGVYKVHLEKWSRISRQAFLPVAINEQMADDEGWIYIEFTLGNVKQRVRARWNYDWLDPDILPQLNHAVAASGFKFCYSQLDEMLIVVVLTESERHQLAVTLSWDFSGDGYIEPKNQLKLDE